MYHSIDNEIDEQIIYKNTSDNTKLHKIIKKSLRN